MSLPKRLNGLGWELVQVGLHVLEDVLIGIRDDKLVFEHFNLGSNSKVLWSVGLRIEKGTMFYEVKWLD